MLAVAPEVLGGVLRHHSPAGTVALRITEVEAYAGERDPASHAYRGLTKRNATMFGPPGHLYCYFIYGMHFSLNMVCSPAGTATGILLRAGEVVEGVDLARHRRLARPRKHPLPDHQLARGPGCVAQCFGASPETDGADLCGQEWSFLPAAEAPPQLCTGGRVGISGPGARPELYPWRFYLPAEPSVSAFVPGRRGTSVR